MVSTLKLLVLLSFTLVGCASTTVTYHPFNDPTTAACYADLTADEASFGCLS